MSTALPPGLTSDMLAAITAYMTAQQEKVKQYKRPSGTLKTVRGVDPEYRYEYREYPKALTPPPVVIANENDERTFRIQQKQPLPWSDVPAMIAQYYAQRQYPVNMQPEQIIVNSVHEEKVRLAEWNIHQEDRVTYPRWLFHPSKPPQLVETADAEHALGKGWFPTIEAATDAALQLREGNETQAVRLKLLERATDLGIQHEPSWSNAKLSDAIAKVEKKKVAA